MNKLYFISMLIVLGSLNSQVNAEIPAAFTAYGSALNDNSDIVKIGKEIVSEPNSIETKFPLETLSELTESEQKTGYVCYSRHYLEMITSSSRPKREEITNKVVVFASPGEYEPVSLCIFSLNGMKDARAEMSDLTTATGLRIAAENIDVRVVRKLVRTSEGSRTTYQYWPLALEKRKSTSVNANDTLQYWLTVYVPPSAKPTIKLPASGEQIASTWTDGVIADSAYKGKFTVSMSGKPDAVFEVSVAVVPAKLVSSKKLYGMCFLPNPRSRGVFPETLDKQMVDMREHGMNSLWTWPEMGVAKTDDGGVIYDFSKPGLFRKDYGYFSLDQIMESYQKAGFKNFWVCGNMDPLKDIIPNQLGYKMGTPEYEKAYVAFVAQLRAHAKVKKWPDYCVHPVDEPGGNKLVGSAKYYYELIQKNFPDQKTFADMGPWHGEDAILIPRCDILCLAIPNPENTKKVLDAGKELWMYNVGSLGQEPKIDRLSFGLAARKIGVKGVFQWVYEWWWENSLKGGFPSGQRYIQPTADGPIPTPAWEGIREGIDDDRYAETLIELANKSSDEKLRAKALAKLEEVLRPVPGGSSAVAGGDLPALGAYRGEYLDKTNGRTFDQNRWEMVRCILELQAAQK